ncbi:MAG: flagellar basal body rod C-terminal domain-containing protein [Planctomycetota bacterium]
MIRALSSAIQGMNTHAEMVNRAAHRIANVNTEGEDVNLPEEMVNLLVGQRGFEANTASVRTADEMLAELLLMKRP